MGVLGDRLDNMRVRAASPDRKIAAELRGDTQVRVVFTPSSYRQYEKSALEQQLVGLARQLWVGRMKKYYAAVSEAFGETVTGEAPPVSPRDVDFYTARGGLIAEGRSADGRVYLAVQGMQRWTVRIADGTQRALTQEEFAVRVSEAAGALIRDQFDKIQVLKQQFYE